MRTSALFVTSMLLLEARPASADIAIGAELNGAVMTRKIGDSLLGFGFAGRLGYAIDLSVLYLIPEVKLGYERTPLVEDVNLLRPMGGVRASIGIGLFAIVLFAHIGYAFPVGASDQVDADGMNYELGGGVDFTSIPWLDIGIWGAFNSVRIGSPAYDWVGIGVQATLTI
jgi:hypothetical protein